MGGQGARPPSNRNASNDKFVRKKVIVASDFLDGLLSDRETFFWSLPNFWVKFGPTLREDLFRFCIMFRSLLRKLWVGPPNLKLNSNYISGPPPIESPKSNCEDFYFCGLPPPNQNSWLRLYYLMPCFKSISFY